MIIKFKENYSPSVLNFYPKFAKNNIGNKILERRKRVLISFHTKKNHSDRELSLIGSGFLVQKEDFIFVATAAHTIRAIEKLNYRYINIEGIYYVLHNIEMFINDEQDYCLFYLPIEIIKKHSKPLAYLPLEFKNQYIATSSFMIFGFPTSRNKVYKEGWAMNTLNLIFHNDFHYETTTEDILFPFTTRGKNPTSLEVESSSAIKSIPSLRGMSGCPIVQLMINIENGAINIRPVGIFKEHKTKHQKYLVGCTFPSFADEVNLLINSFSKNQSLNEDNFL